MSIYDTAMRFRGQLLRGEREEARKLIDLYGETWLRIRQQMESLLRRIEAAEEIGLAYPREWWIRVRRWQALMDEIRREIDGLEMAAMNHTMRQQSIALRHAEAYVQALFADMKVMRHFAGVPTGAVESIVGFLADGSPLREVLADLGDRTGKAMEQALQQGVVAGEAPAQIVKRVRQQAGGALRRLLTIARTETLRAYREGIRIGLESAGYRRWMWVASLSVRTCPACLAMHGRTFNVETPFGTHPNCRCTMVPVDDAITIPDAEQWLKGLEEAKQDEVLGKERARLWREGKITMDDFVQEMHSEKWGTTRTVKPVHALDID